MKRVIRLTESQLVNLIKRTIKEDEQEAMMSTIESDPRFDEIVDYLSGLDSEEIEHIEDVVNGEVSQGEYTEAKRTVYKDYGPDRGPVEISKSEFIKRKLLSVLPASIVGAIMGIAMAGGMSADDVLQMALGTAAVTGGIGAGLISTVSREKVDVPDEEEMDAEENPMTESYRRKKVIRLTESDLIRLIKRIVEDENEVEDEEEYLYHHPASMGSGKWYRNTFMNQGEPEEYSDGDLDIEDISTMNVDDTVISPYFKKRLYGKFPELKRAKLKKKP